MAPRDAPAPRRSSARRVPLLLASLALLCAAAGAGAQKEERYRCPVGDPCCTWEEPSYQLGKSDRSIRLMRPSRLRQCLGRLRITRGQVERTVDALKSTADSLYAYLPHLKEAAASEHVYEGMREHEAIPYTKDVLAMLEGVRTAFNYSTPYLNGTMAATPVHYKFVEIMNSLHDPRTAYAAPFGDYLIGRLYLLKSGFSFEGAQKVIFEGCPERQCYSLSDMLYKKLYGSQKPDVNKHAGKFILSINGKDAMQWVVERAQSWTSYRALSARMNEAMGTMYESMAFTEAPIRDEDVIVFEDGSSITLRTTILAFRGFKSTADMQSFVDGVQYERVVEQLVQKSPDFCRSDASFIDTNARRRRLLDLEEGGEDEWESEAEQVGLLQADEEQMVGLEVEEDGLEIEDLEDDVEDEFEALGGARRKLNQFYYIPPLPEIRYCDKSIPGAVWCYRMSDSVIIKIASFDFPSLTFSDGLKKLAEVYQNAVNLAAVLPAAENLLFDVVGNRVGWEYAGYFMLRLLYPHWDTPQELCEPIDMRMSDMLTQFQSLFGEGYNSLVGSTPDLDPCDLRQKFADMEMINSASLAMTTVDLYDTYQKADAAAEAEAIPLEERDDTFPEEHAEGSYSPINIEAVLEAREHIATLRTSAEQNAAYREFLLNATWLDPEFLEDIVTLGWWPMVPTQLSAADGELFSPLMSQWRDTVRRTRGGVAGRYSQKFFSEACEIVSDVDMAPYTYPKNWTRIILLSDQRCSGACATFATKLTDAGLATTVAYGHYADSIPNFSSQEGEHVAVYNAWHRYYNIYTLVGAFLKGATLNRGDIVLPLATAAEARFATRQQYAKTYGDGALPSPAYHVRPDWHRFDFWAVAMEGPLQNPITDETQARMYLDTLRGNGLPFALEKRDIRDVVRPASRNKTTLDAVEWPRVMTRGREWEALAFNRSLYTQFGRAPPLTQLPTEIWDSFEWYFHFDKEGFTVFAVVCGVSLLAVVVGVYKYKPPEEPDAEEVEAFMAAQQTKKMMEETPASAAAPSARNTPMSAGGPGRV
mmetsp:Transcript_26417/g.90303  ORF Transcript_26417/g.90303 Transcript_26417/m.90303 type:complete len:1042 (+) Transcript_26417:170-3295(+)